MNYSQPPELAFSPCERAQDTIFSLMEAEPVSEAEQDFLILHLSDCENCRSYQESMGYLSASLTDLETVVVPAGLEERIMAQVQAEKPANVVPIRPQRSVWLKAGPVAAAVLVLAIAVPLVLRNLTPSSTPGASVVASKQVAPQVAPTVAMQGGVSDEVILQEGRAPKLSQPEPEKKQIKTETETVEPKSEPVKGRDQRNQLAESTPAVIAQAPKKVTAPAGNVSSQPSKTVRASQSTAPVEVAATEDSEPLQLAFAGSLNVQEIYASDDESDVYYDPVSTLVGF